MPGDTKPPVTIDVFPDKKHPGEWELEVGIADAALHKKWGNPLVYDSGFESSEEAKMNGEFFATAEGHPIAGIKIWEAASDAQ